MELLHRFDYERLNGRVIALSCDISFSKTVKTIKTQLLLQGRNVFAFHLVLKISYNNLVN